MTRTVVYSAALVALVAGELKLFIIFQMQLGWCWWVFFSNGVPKMATFTSGKRDFISSQCSGEVRPEAIIRTSWLQLFLSLLFYVAIVSFL